MMTRFIVSYKTDHPDETGYPLEASVTEIVDGESALSIRAIFDAEIKFRHLLSEDTERYQNAALAAGPGSPDAAVLAEHIGRLTAPVDVGGRMFPHVHCLQSVGSVCIRKVAERA